MVGDGVADSGRETAAAPPEPGTALTGGQVLEPGQAAGLGNNQARIVQGAVRAQGLQGSGPKSGGPILWSAGTRSRFAALRVPPQQLDIG